MEPGVVEPGMERGVEPRMEAGSSTEAEPLMLWYQPEVVEARVEARMMMAVAESSVEVPVMETAVVAAVPAPGRGHVWLPEESESETKEQDETQPFHGRFLLRRIVPTTAKTWRLADVFQTSPERSLFVIYAPCRRRAHREG